jgi:hypothetical protein
VIWVLWILSLLWTGLLFQTSRRPVSSSFTLHPWMSSFTSRSMATSEAPHLSTLLTAVPHFLLRNCFLVLMDSILPISPHGSPTAEAWKPSCREASKVVIMDAEGIHDQLCQLPGFPGPHCHFLLALSMADNAAQDDLIPLPGPKGRGGAWRMLNPQLLLPHTILELRKSGKQLPLTFA